MSEKWIFKNTRWKDMQEYKWQTFKDIQWKELQVKLHTIKTNYQADLDFKVDGANILYSGTNYEASFDFFVSVVASERDYYYAMREWLPYYRQVDKTIDDILRVQATELRTIEQLIEEMQKDMYVVTAVEGLKYHERLLGLLYDKTLSLQERRERILAKYWALVGQTTEDTIKHICRAYQGGEVDILETDIEGLYNIKFVSTIGRPQNLDIIEEVLYEIFPAHLDFKFTFTYLTWGEYSKYKWGELRDITWQEMRTVKE